jgi:CRP-like cAMP-binding protein
VGLAKMGPGGYVGEMALFDNLVRSATVTTTEDTRLLVLHKAEFTEAVREYPQVALQVCKELSRRLRGLQKKIEDMEVCELPGA